MKVDGFTHFHMSLYSGCYGAVPDSVNDYFVKSGKDSLNIKELNSIPFTISDSMWFLRYACEITEEDRRDLAILFGRMTMHLCAWSAAECGYFEEFVNKTGMMGFLNHPRLSNRSIHIFKAIECCNVQYEEQFYWVHISAYLNTFWGIKLTASKLIHDVIDEFVKIKYNEKSKAIAEGGL